MSQLIQPLGLPIGLQLYTLNAEMYVDARATLHKVAAMGYTEVEPARFGPLPRAADVRAQLDECGLECPSAHLQFNLNDLGKTFDEAHTLGCSYATISVPRMLLWPPLENPFTLPPAELGAVIARIFAPMSRDEVERTAAALNTVGEAAKSAGLKFAVHNHTMELADFEGRTGLEVFAALTEPELVKFEFDLGWAVLTGTDPCKFVEEHPGRVTMLHLRDFLPHTKAEPPMVGNTHSTDLGTGVVDYAAVFSRLKGKGIEHCFVERDAVPGATDTVERIQADYKFLAALGA